MLLILGFLVVGRCIPRVATADNITDAAGNILQDDSQGYVTGNRLEKAVYYLARFYRAKEVKWRLQTNLK